MIWDRAALASGGDSLRAGDRALASLLRMHALIMNGGVHHALECLKREEVLGAADGYEFFGFVDVARFFRRAPEDPMLSEWTDDHELAANDRYEEMIQHSAATGDEFIDAILVARFERVLRERPEQFAPITP